MQFFCPDEDGPTLDAALLSEAHGLAREASFGEEEWGPRVESDNYPRWGLND